MTNKIQWGIIGCGDVTEHKSGPAFNKVPGSSLLAVMRRDAEKVKDYARRHAVPKYYTDAQQLINDPDINAIYIATPPSSHEAYALAAINAGKPVYVEKPMALNFAAAEKIKQTAAAKNIKLVVAHYRRAQPYFNKIKELVDEAFIGKIQNVQLLFTRQLLDETALTTVQKAWRVDPAISGGGLFHDMAPHQLGLMLYFFGEVKTASGTSFNSNSVYNADDRVEGQIIFENEIVFNGEWNFNAAAEKDECIIYAGGGHIKFSVFGEQEIHITKNGKSETIAFEAPLHVQQPMIERVVQYFLGHAANPCPPEEGCEVMRLIELFTTR